jgi:anion-transporting  ArsA/GET3 family ATPase
MTTTTPPTETPVVTAPTLATGTESLLEQNPPAYLRNRMEMQRGQMAEIERGFGTSVLAHVPELERDVTGLEMIERVADLMYGSGRPSDR